MQVLKTTCFPTLQGLLTHVLINQPDDPIAYFHEELTKIKKEVEEQNVIAMVTRIEDAGSFLCVVVHVSWRWWCKSSRGGKDNRLFPDFLILGLNPLKSFPTISIQSEINVIHVFSLQSQL